LKNLVDEWLRDYKEKTAQLFRYRLQKFLDYAGLKPEELLRLDIKEIKHRLIEFVKYCQDKKIPNNSILAYVHATRLFCENYGKTVKFKRSQLPRVEKAKGYHNFSNGDLARIFELADLKYKALISLHASSGFSISDLLALDKDFIKKHLERAKSEKKNFCFIELERIKTGSRGLLCINPLAFEWLEKWIKQNPHKKLFPITTNAYNNMLQKIAKKSGITLEGKVRSHNIRKWLINSLIKAGFSSEEWKYVVAKSIGLSDDTYLNLKPIIIEKYQKVYDKYLNILGSTIKPYQNEIEKLKQVIIALEKQNKILETRIKILQENLNRVSTRIGSIEETLELHGIKIGKSRES